MPAFGGVRGTGDFGTDERPKSFREMILFRNPNGNAPIFALTSKMSKATKTDPEFSWWAEPHDIVRLQTAAALNASATAVTVDSGDPTATNFGARYGSALNLKQGDLLMVEPATDAAASTPEILEVTANPSSATALTVKRGAAGSTAAAIKDNTFLLKIGSAHEEGSRAPQAVSRNPIKYSNYTQIFKDTYKITGTADKTTFRTGDAYSNDKKRKAFDHSRDIEMALLFGRKSETTGTDGKPKRTMDGLMNLVPKSYMTASYKMSAFFDAISPVFDWDSEAGDTRLAFIGNGAINALNKKLMAEDNASQINFDNTSTMYGIRFTHFRVPQGDIMLKTHPLLSRHPLYTNSMFIIDGSALKYCCLPGRDTKVKENVQENDEDARRGMYLTECSIMLDNGGVTCRYIGNMAV